MTENIRLSAEELAEIRKRSEAASQYDRRYIEQVTDPHTAPLLFHAREDVSKLLAEIERLTGWLKLIENISELPEEPCDYVPVTALFEINLRAKEALKDGANI